ncbi:MAG: serine hydrolase [Myxococcales bacterium]|jgi:CubicO group peptidase (beta-lactamase class C family)
MSKRGWMILGALSLLGVSLYAILMQGKSLADIPAGTGYAALDLCSRTMVTGEPPEQVRTRYLEPRVQPLPNYWEVERVVEQYVAVSTWLPGLEHRRRAIYREGLGCTVLAPGADEASVRAQELRPPTALPPDARPWPLGEGPAADGGLEAASREVVDRHATRLFDPQAAATDGFPWNTTALLIAREGELVYERYGQGHTREQRQLGWSMTKTLTAIIAGTLAREGKLALDEPVGLPRWQGTPKADITWRALLNMAPGLAWDEGYAGASDATEMLFSQPDQGAWAADRPLTSEPGTVFNYSTGFPNIAMLRMRQLLGGSPEAIQAHYQRRLFAPLGIRAGVIEVDASGTPVGGARGLLRPVDWLRLGQLLQNGGSWDGAEVLAPEWVRFMFAASEADAQYGGYLWRQPCPRIEPALRARLPEDLVFFAGVMGQFVVIVPGEDLIVLRMGVSLVPHDRAHDVVLNAVLELVADLLTVGDTAPRGD